MRPPPKRFMGPAETAAFMGQSKPPTAVPDKIDETEVLPWETHTPGTPPQHPAWKLAHEMASVLTDEDVVKIPPETQRGPMIGEEALEKSVPSREVTDLSLLQVIRQAIKTFGLNEADVEWVGSKNGKLSMDWLLFVGTPSLGAHLLPGNVSLPNDFVIVASGWWMERWDNGFSPVWQVYRAPVRAPDTKMFDEYIGFGLFEEINARTD